VGNNPLGTFLPLILLLLIFYFLLLRPQRKRQQELIQMQNSLTPGMRVMTSTGLFATVVALRGDDVILEVAPGVETRWVKAAIARIVPPEEGEAQPGPAGGTGDAQEDKPGSES